jgi:hypothetical protein
MSLGQEIPNPKIVWAELIQILSCCAEFLNPEIPIVVDNLQSLNVGVAPQR